MIEIIYNGEKELACDNQTLFEFLIQRGFSAATFAVSINETFVPRAEYKKTLIQKGDHIDVLTAIPGG